MATPLHVCLCDIHVSTTIATEMTCVLPLCAVVGLVTRNMQTLEKFTTKLALYHCIGTPFQLVFCRGIFVEVSLQLSKFPHPFTPPSPSLSPSFSLFISVDAVDMKPRQRLLEALVKKAGRIWCLACGTDILDAKHFLNAGSTVNVAAARHLGRLAQYK